MERVGDLEVAQDLSFQDAQWRVQRLGWGFMTFIVLLALAGALGNGPIAEAEAVAGDLHVRYERFIRHRSPSALLVDVGALPTDGAVRLWFDREYVSGLELQSIHPEPDSVEIQAERVIYTFSATSPPVTITFNLMHEGIGVADAEAGLDGGPSTRFRQTVYP